MKVGLFRYIKSHCAPSQVIIVENNIPDINYANVNLVHFSKDNTNGRYGFLLDLMDTTKEA